MVKSVLAIMLTKTFSDSHALVVITALSVLLGHIFPVFSGFRGGKGVAPGWAGLFVISPIAGTVASILGLGTIALTKYVSLGSLIGALSGSATLITLCLLGSAPNEYIWFGIIGTGITFIAHRENVARLASNQERKFGDQAQT